MRRIYLFQFYVSAIQTLFFLALNDVSLYCFNSMLVRFKLVILDEHEIYLAFQFYVSAIQTAYWDSGTGTVKMFQFYVSAIQTSITFFFIGYFIMFQFYVSAIQTQIHNRNITKRKVSILC